jgi:NTE family protein
VHFPTGREVIVLIRSCLYFILLILFTQSGDASVSGSADNRGGKATQIITPTWGEYEKQYLDVIPYRRLKRPSIGLVLSGGGFRGIAHVGVIEVLEEHNIPIDLIVGASMGSLIGALYAGGYSTTSMLSLVDTTDWQEVLRFSDDSERRDLFVNQKVDRRRGIFTLRFDGIAPVIPAAVTPASKLSRYINELVLQGIYHPSNSFDDLRIPYRSVATDLISGKRIVFDRGDLVQAIRSSISIPLVFSPVRQDTLLLVDGGLVSNIPVDIARDYGCDIVIAVNTTSGMRLPEDMNAPWEIADQIITIMQQRWNEDQLRLADVVITPPIDQYLGTDFSHLHLYIEEGRRTAEEQIPGLLKKIDEYYETSFPENGMIFVNPNLSFTGVGMSDEFSYIRNILSSQDTISRRDLVSVLNKIYESGYYRDVYAEVTYDGSLTAINIHLTPYPLLRDITMSGNSDIESDVLSEICSPVIGEIFNVHRMKSAMEGILSVYRSRGYSLARITSAVFDEGSGVVEISIDEGMIGGISIQGNRKTKLYVIRREFTLNKGELFRVVLAMQGIRNINGTGLFDQVLLQVAEQDGERHLIIHVDEKYSELLRLSLRVDEAYHFQPIVEIKNENFFGNAIEAGVMIGGGLHNRIYSGHIITHRIFNTYLSARVEGYHYFEDIPVYRDEPNLPPVQWRRLKDGEYRHYGSGAAVTIGTQVERLGLVSAGLRTEWQEIRQREAGSYETGKQFIVANRFSSIFDTYNRYPFPEEGVGFHAFYEVAASFLGSDKSYSKFYIDYESYATYGLYHTLRPRIVFGFGDDTLPLTEFFKLGGKDSFYGMRQNEYRGRQIFALNFEYRYKLPFKILVDTYLHARYDLGAVWRTAQEIRLSDLKHGIGFGIGFDTVIFGPIEFGIGRAYLNRGDISDTTVPTGPIYTYFNIGVPLLY